MLRKDELQAMKAVATALVLIVGAAVVLWYGNTLNSWVLGGLIGGLAALLLSIPISLMLFAYLARRHNERQPVEEEVSLARAYDYDDREEVWDEEGERLRQFYYDEERSRQHLEEPEETVSRRDVYGMAREDVFPSKRITRKMPQRRLTRSQMQSEALRAARKEAAQQFEEYEEEMSRFSRRPLERDLYQSPPERSSRRLSRGLSEQADRREQMSNVYPRHRNRGDTHSVRPQRRREPETDYLYEEELLQTDQIDFSAQRYDPEAQTDNLQRPMIRRAPYLYEDDPLRQELSQYVDEPITRRSSRLDSLRPRTRRDEL
ncbi:MAG: hypothetical protein J2P36_08405 [Ktedonobacteraceae bacterium]|nr:hypothetical protein [Ktedonobacteraceae bacterium]